MWQFMEIKGNVKRGNQSCLKSQSFNLEKWARKELVSPKKILKENGEIGVGTAQRSEGPL